MATNWFRIVVMHAKEANFVLTVAGNQLKLPHEYGLLEACSRTTEKGERW